MRKQHATRLWARQRAAALLLVALVGGNLPTATSLWASSTQDVLQQDKRTTVVGQVKDADGNPIPGANIRLKGTDRGTITDIDGKFSLPSVPENGTLVASFIGMQTEEVPLNGRSVFVIVLKDDSRQLNEVVVTGYQEIKRERMTGASSTIKASDIKGLSYTSMDQILKGRIAGVATTTTGRPGEDASIRIRGANSLTGNMEPIWVIDGMPMQGEPPVVGSQGSLEAMLFQTGIGNIPPENIESITVLKDAAATAIYGARAANGVIVVTTKKGTEGRTSVNVSAQFTLTDRPHKNVRMMNSAEKIRFEREIYADYAPTNGGRVADLLNRVSRGVLSSEEAEAQIKQLQAIDTDWFKEMYRMAFSKQISASVSGGSSQTQHFTTANYLDQQGTEYNNRFRRFTLSTKLNHTFNKNLKFETNLSGVYRANQSTAASINSFNYALYANPYESPDGYDRSWDMAYSRVQEGLEWNKLNAKQEILNNTAYSRYIEAMVNSKLEWTTPLPGLTATLQGTLAASASNNREEIKENTYTSFKNNWIGYWAYANMSPNFARGSLNEGSYTSNSYTLRGLLSYRNHFADKHFVEVMAGSEGTKRLMYNSSTYFPTFDSQHRVVGYPELVEGTDLRNIPFQRLGSTGRHESRLLSYFLTGSYSYDDRYTLSGSIRYDGSDIIGNNNQFTPLWNMSARWNLHNEAFLKDGFFSLLSLRAGYGYTGSIDKTALPFVVMTITSNQLYDGLLVPQSFNYANPNVKWQTKRDFNIGLETEMLNRRLQLNVNYYHNYVFDLLDTRQRPLSSGVESITQNVASLVNRGWEIDVRGDLISTPRFSWNAGVNVAFNTNKVVKTYYKGTDALPKSFSGRETVFVEGYSSGAWFGFKFAGIDPSTGNVLVYQKDGTTFDMDQLQNATLELSVPEPSFLGHRNPPITGGITTSLRYDNWTLNSGMEFVAGHHILSFNEYGSLGSRNRYITDMRRWRTAGDVTDRPSINGVSRAPYSYRYDTNLEKGDYLRCSYVSLSYQVPPTLVKKLQLQSLSVSLTANNLFTLTRYKGIDPALMGSISYPNTRSYMVALNLGL